MKRLRRALAVSLLSLQLAGILYARGVDTRYFCWAPYDMLTVYSLQVEVNGRTLSDDEVLERYHRPRRGMDNRNYHNVIEIVELTERRYHPLEHVEITLSLDINGSRQVRWRFHQ